MSRYELAGENTAVVTKIEPDIIFTELSETVETPVETPEVEVTPEPEVISLGVFKLTAYCSCGKCCDGWADNRPVDEYGNEVVIGAAGEVLTAGYSVAVDPKVIPYGTVISIDGRDYKAQDCGGAIKGNEIDVYFSNHSEALEFGVQYAEVKIFK
jgi:3D (Asp-Asp-Asp) domain-containing protein